jgi:hypothetical protein
MGNGDGSTANTFRFRKGGNDKLQLQTNNVSGQDSSGTIISGNWIHTVFVSSGSTLGYEVFINGTSDNTGTMPTYNITDSTFLSVAKRADNNSARWIGDIDDVRFYNRVLTSTEVNDLYLYR